MKNTLSILVLLLCTVLCTRVRSSLSHNYFLSQFNSLSSPSIVLFPTIYSRNSDPGSRCSNLISYPPSPLRYVPCIFIEVSALSSLVDSRRIVPTCPPTIGALDSRCHLRNKKSVRTESQTHEMNATRAGTKYLHINSIRG